MCEQFLAPSEDVLERARCLLLLFSRTPPEGAPLLELPRSCAESGLPAHSARWAPRPRSFPSGQRAPQGHPGGLPCSPQHRQGPVPAQCPVRSYRVNNFLLDVYPEERALSGRPQEHGRPGGGCLVLTGAPREFALDLCVPAVRRTNAPPQTGRRTRS